MPRDTKAEVLNACCKHVSNISDSLIMGLSGLGAGWPSAPACSYDRLCVSITGSQTSGPFYLAVRKIPATDVYSNTVHGRLIHRVHCGPAAGHPCIVVRGAALGGPPC